MSTYRVVQGEGPTDAEGGVVKLRCGNLADAKKYIPPRAGLTPVVCEDSARIVAATIARSSEPDALALADRVLGACGLDPRYAVTSTEDGRVELPSLEPLEIVLARARDQHCAAALRRTNGNVTRAAELIGVTLRTLQRWRAWPTPVPTEI